MLRNRTKTFTGLVTLACTAALLSLPTESVGQDGHKDNTQQSYNDVMSAIQTKWADMRGGWNDQQNQDYLTLSDFNDPSPLRPAGSPAGNAKDQVLVQYNFNAGDAIFGVYGSHSVLGGLHAQSKPKHEKDYIYKGVYNIADYYLTKGTVPIGEPWTQNYKKQGVNARTTPWLSKAGELRDYLNNRKNEWDLETSVHEDGSVFQRAAQVSGMGYDTNTTKGFGYANNYIVEMWIDKDAIFRPNLHQSVDITQAGSFEAVWDKHSQTYAPNTTKDAWLSGLNGQMLDGNGDEISSFGKSSTNAPGFYDLWWDASFNSGTPGVPSNPFPWTGIGYTYDWYYQNANGTKWYDYWHTIQADGFGYGQGVAEYVLRQSNEDGTDPINFDIVNVQTTYQYMGGTNGLWGQVPEPTSLTIFGMAALAGLGMHRRRRR